MPTGEQDRFQAPDQHVNLSTFLPKHLICCSLLVLLELLFPLQIFCSPVLFLPLQLLLHIIPHVYSLVFFQAESHFIVSCSYFLLLCRSLCIISLSSAGLATFSCPGPRANWLNDSPQPLPAVLPFFVQAKMPANPGQWCCTTYPHLSKRSWEQWGDAHHGWTTWHQISAWASPMERVPNGYLQLTTDVFSFSCLSSVVHEENHKKTYLKLWRQESCLLLQALFTQ